MIQRSIQDFIETGVESDDARFLGKVANDAGGLIQWIEVERLLTSEVRNVLFCELVQKLMPLLEIIALLRRDSLGHDVASVGVSLIERAVKRRINANDLRDVSQYAELLQRSQPELQSLYEAVIVPGTFSFDIRNHSPRYDKSLENNSWEPKSYAR